MAITADDLEKYFPYYLTAEQAEGLAKALADFDGSRSSFYTPEGFDELSQGDGISGLDVIDLETGARDKIQGIVLSNTCDVNAGNSRDLPARLMFVQIVRLGAYESLLEKAGKSRESIDSKSRAIKEQKVTNLFHLPQGAGLQEPFIAVLDDVKSIPLRLYSEDTNKKLFSLDMLGFYLLLFKLAIHFCRVHENKERPISKQISE